MLLSKYAVCGSKNSSFIKEQEANGIIGSLVKTLSNIPILGPVLFWTYEINEIVNKFLLAENKFMPEIHLRKLGFTYFTCRLFTKNEERIQRFKEADDSRYIY